jgi:FkbM family methyltransferase
MIFIEIGAHYGQSYEVAKHPKYPFNEFWLFEPSITALERLYDISDKRLKIFPIGLAAKNYDTLLYKPGSKGGSIFLEKFANYSAPSSQRINIRKASEILAPILTENRVFIKINCEGSEVDILNDLLDFSLLNEMHSILVDFDICRIKKDFPIENLRKKLKASGVYFYEADFFGAKHSDTNVKRWLNFELKSSFVKFTIKEYIVFKLKFHLPFRRRIILIFAEFVPVKYKIKLLVFFKKIFKLLNLLKHN